MNYNYLKAVFAVYQTGSFSSAAYELFISQSSVSKNVAKAEEMLGVKLFERSGNRVTPTAAGKTLMGPIEQAVRSYDTLLKEAEAYARHGGKPLTISTTPLAQGLQLTEMFRQCSAAFPGPKLQIKENTNRKSIMALESGEADLAITVQTYMDGEPCGPFAISKDPKFLLQPIFRDDYYCVVPAGHPYAGMKEVDLAMLRGENFIAVDDSFASYHAMLDKAFAPLGFRPNVVLSVSAISSVLEMVAAGMGVSILTSRVTKGRDGILLIPLRQDLCRETALVCLDRKPLPTILQWLIRYARKQFDAAPVT